MSSEDSTRELVPVLDLGVKAIRVPMGQRFGRLVVIGGPLGRIESVNRVRILYWLCRCDCGVEKAFRLNVLRRGMTRSCGCYAREQSSARRKTHGRHPRRLYNIWASMLGRCLNTNDQAYSDYGGRGIQVCPEWKEDFPAFRDWAIANGYEVNLSLDRYPDNGGGYEPSNCRWATQHQQANNTRSNRRAEIFGETKTITEWANDPRCTVTRGSLVYRINHGWPPELALTLPPDVGQRPKW